MTEVDTCRKRTKERQGRGYRRATTIVGQREGLHFPRQSHRHLYFLRRSFTLPSPSLLIPTLSPCSLSLLDRLKSLFHFPRPGQRGEGSLRLDRPDTPSLLADLQTPSVLQAGPTVKPIMASCTSNLLVQSSVTAERFGYCMNGNYIIMLRITGGVNNLTVLPKPVPEKYRKCGSSVNPLALSISHGRNAMESPEPPSLALCRYATCNIHDWPGRRERRGLEGKGRGERGVRPTDRWFPLWSDAQTSNQLSLDPSLPSTEMSKIASKFFTTATNHRRLSRPFPSTGQSGRTENGFRADLILMLKLKPHDSGMDGWLHPSVLPSHSQTYPRLIADVMN